MTGIWQWRYGTEQTRTYTLQRSPNLHRLECSVIRKAFASYVPTISCWIRESRFTIPEGAGRGQVWCYSGPARVGIPPRPEDPVNDLRFISKIGNYSERKDHRYSVLGREDVSSLFEESGWATGSSLYRKVLSVMQKVVNSTPVNAFRSAAFYLAAEWPYSKQYLSPRALRRSW